MKKFNIGDEIKFNVKGTNIPDFEAKSPYIKHGKCSFNENKGTIVGEYKGQYAVSFIAYDGKEVILDFLPEVLILMKPISPQYEIY